MAIITNIFKYFKTNLETILLKYIDNFKHCDETYKDLLNLNT